MDMGYDHEVIDEEFEARDCHPVIPLWETPAVKAGKHLPPVCAHGAWTFAGSDAKRQAARWRCPTVACSPASTWVKASRLHTLIARRTARWKQLYRVSAGRSSGSSASSSTTGRCYRCASAAWNGSSCTPT